MDHPFEEGKQYRNRKDQYTVLVIEGPKMRIRYEDGTEQIVTIATQERIWNALQLEAEQLKPARTRSKTGRKKKPRRAWAKRGHEFTGLIDTDFKDDIAGTYWRSRENLGGLLALELSESTSRFFQSWAVRRRTEVHICLPEHYNYNDAIPYAKLELRLSSDGAQFGFYIERADLSREMTGLWHWQPFINALTAGANLQETIQNAMADHDLFWLLSLEEGPDEDEMPRETIKVTNGSPLLWNETETIDWPELISRLNSMPVEQFLNVRLCAWTNKQDAIDLQERFAEQVVPVFKAILPLYLATTGA